MGVEDEPRRLLFEVVDPLGGHRVRDGVGRDGGYVVSVLRVAPRDAGSSR